MNALLQRFRLLALVGLCCWPTSTLRADEKPATRWEYRVLTKDQILEQGKNDLAAGLNKLGSDGWELVLLDGGYVFKRPQTQNTKQIADLKLTIKYIEGDVEILKERAAWSERMLKSGYLSTQAVLIDQERLRRAELALEKARKELETLSPTPKDPMEKAPLPQPLPKPEK